VTPSSIELRRSPLLPAVPLFIAAGVIAAERNLWTGVADWANASAATAAATQLMTPIVAGMAAWAGGRERRRRLSGQALLSARPRLAAALAELLASVTWPLFAFVVVSVTVFVQTVVRDHAGTPSALLVLTAAAGLTCVAAASWILGRLVPGRAVTPVVALAGYFVPGFLMQRAEWWYLLSPVTVQRGDPWLPFRASLLLGQVVFFAGLTGSLMFGWGLLRERREHRWLMAIGTAASLLVTVVGAFQVNRQHGGYYGRIADAEYSCKTNSDGPEVCLVASFRPGLDVVQRELAVAQARLLQAGLQLPPVNQRPRGLGGEPPAGHVAINLDDLAPATVAVATTDVIAQVLTPIASCRSATDAVAQFNAAADSVLANWLLGRAPLVLADPGLGRLASWSTSENDAGKIAWLRRHAALVHACALSPRDFA
jgi:hypothetical protein